MSQHSNLTNLVNSINSGSYPNQSVRSVPFDEDILQDARRLFAKALARLIKNNERLSKKGLADYLDVQPQMVSRWLAGGTIPLKYMGQIAEYCGCKISDLFTEEIESNTRINSNLIDIRTVRQEDWLRGLAKSLGYEIRKAKSED